MKFSKNIKPRLYYGTKSLDLLEKKTQKSLKKPYVLLLRSKISIKLSN